MPTPSISGAVLAAWCIKGYLNLRASELFGVEPALRARLGLVGPHPEGDDAKAVHSATASYSAAGFEAAALAALDVEIGDMSHLLEQRGVERRASLFFDHPHAVIAVTGTTSDCTVLERGTRRPSVFHSLLRGSMSQMMPSHPTGRKKSLSNRGTPTMGWTHGKIVQLPMSSAIGNLGDEDPE